MNRIYYILSAALLLAACTEELTTTIDKPLPPVGMAEVRLGEIRLNDADATLSPEISSATRAAGNLASGSTLRLYAFKKGITDFNDKLATRTYTISADGVAELDAGQQPLYLPSGEVDIYLAGPVAKNIGTEADPYWQDVASASSITPSQGVDLIAAYTSATIKPGTINPLPAIILVHKMSRVQVVVSRHTSGVYENMVVTEIKLYAQPQIGTFAFDATGGTITPEAEANFTYPKIVAEIQNEKYSGTALLIPQLEKDIKIETTFECNQINVDTGDNHPTLRYRQSGLISAALTAGAATRFTASPLTPVEIKWRTKVLPWDEVTQENITIPGLAQAPPVTKGLVGWYDGHNPPIRINNVLVWRDNSTQKNHGKILDGTTWESTTNSYLIERAPSGFELIKEDASYLYSAQNGMTVEMIWKRVNEYGDVSIFRIGKDGEPQTTLTSWKPAGSKFCAWNEDGFYKNYTWGASTKDEDVDNFACWAWAKGGHEKSSGYYSRGYKNGVPQTTGSSTTAKALTGKSHITFGSSIAGWRIQAIRIYNRQLTNAEIELNHDFDKQYYGLIY